MLTLELRAGQTLLVNGGPVLFATSARICLPERVRAVGGRRYMPPAQATTPARRFYVAVQTAYAGLERERDAALALARDLAPRLGDGAQAAAVLRVLDAGHGFPALKLAWDLVAAEPPRGAPALA